MGLLKPLWSGTRIATFRYIKLMDEGGLGEFVTSQFQNYFYCCCNCGYWQEVKAPGLRSFRGDDFPVGCDKRLQAYSNFQDVTPSQQNEFWAEHMAEKFFNPESITVLKDISSSPKMDKDRENSFSTPYHMDSQIQTLSDKSKTAETEIECLSSQLCVSSSTKIDTQSKSRECTISQSGLPKEQEQLHLVSHPVNDQLELLQHQPLKSKYFPERHKEPDSNKQTFLASSSSSSCDMRNSPTDLNSNKHLHDKPPLFKRFTVGHADDDRQPLVAKLPPFLTGYVNEASTETKGNESKSSDKKGRLMEVKRFICKPMGCHNLNSKGNLKTKNSLLQESDQCDSSTSVLPPPLPQRCDSLLGKSEEGELQFAPWFQAGIPREIALEILAHEPIGSFLVRESTSKPGCFALSLRVPKHFQPSGIAHYLIMHTNKGYRIKGFTKDFSTLPALIVHHSVMPELLPCPLLLSRYLPTFSKHKPSRDFADLDSNAELNSLKVNEK